MDRPAPLTADATATGNADALDDEKRAVDRRLVEQLQLRPGDAILETACGTAGAGLAVAAALGPAGHVTCSDASAAMLDAARAVAHRRGVTNVDFRLLDAERLSLADASVDGVVCRLGLQVLDDPAAALAEAHRVLRPGRRLVVAVWSERGRNPWAAVPESVLGVEAEGPGPFAFDLPRLSATLVAAGFADVVLDRVRADQRYASPEAYWAFHLRKARGVRAAFAQLAPEQQDDAQREVLRRLAWRRLPAGDAFVLPAEMLVAAATRS